MVVHRNPAFRPLRAGEDQASVNLSEGWNTLMLVPIPMLIAICVGLFVVRQDPLLDRAAIAARD